MKERRKDILKGCLGIAVGLALTIASAWAADIITGKDRSTPATVANPFPVETEINGAAPSDSNPVPDAPAQGATLLNAAPTVSGANASATKTLTGTAGLRICIREIVLYASGAAATSTVVIADSTAATTYVDLGTLSLALNGPPQLFSLPPLCFPAGDTATITVGAGGTGAITHLSVIADQQ